MIKISLNHGLFSVKKLLAFTVLMLIGVRVSAQEAEKRQQYVVDEVVAVVGSSMILLSDLLMAEEYLKNEYVQRGYTGQNPRAEALESLLMQKLLMTQAAKDSLAVNEASVEQQSEARLQQLISSRGTIQELEKYYNKPIFAIKDILKTKTRESEMASAMQNDVQRGVAVTPADVARFYKKINKDSLPIIPEQYVFAKIAKLPSKSDQRKLDVKEQLLDIRSRIIKGASFGALARMYSDDPSSAVRGGELEPGPLNIYVPAFRDAAEALQIGTISEVIETEHGFHIIEVLEKSGNIYRLRHILMKVKFNPDDKVKAIHVMDSIAHKIQVDSLDFEEAVKLHSDDDKTKVNKGLVTNTNYERYGARYKTTRFTKEELGRLFDKVGRLKINEVSDSFEFTDDMLEESVLIVKLLEILPSHIANIDDDYTVIEEMTKGERQSNKFEKWLNDKIDEMYIRIEEPYRDIQLSNSRWKK